MTWKKCPATKKIAKSPTGKGAKKEDTNCCAPSDVGFWSIATVGFGLQHASIACNKCAPPGRTNLCITVHTPADLVQPALPVQVYESGTTVCFGDTTIPWVISKLDAWTIIYNDGNILIWAVAQKGATECPSLAAFFPHDFPDPGGDRHHLVDGEDVPCASPYHVVA